MERKFCIWLILQLFIYHPCSQIFSSTTGLSALPDHNTHPVLNFKREWFIPENQPVGEFSSCWSYFLSTCQVRDRQDVTILSLLFIIIVSKSFIFSSLPLFALFQIVNHQSCLLLLLLFSLTTTITGSKVITVRTRDSDRDNVTYGLEAALYQDGSQFFSIDSKSGDVFLKESFEGQVRVERVTYRQTDKQLESKAIMA